MSEQQGYYQKYIIHKANGEPIDPDADYFVLRLDNDLYARRAAWFYADCIAEKNPQLYADIKNRVSAHDFRIATEEEEELLAPCPECGSMDTAPCLHVSDWRRCGNCHHDWDEAEDGAL